jgi:hypothetical protein
MLWSFQESARKNSGLSPKRTESGDLRILGWGEYPIANRDRPLL